MQTIKMGLALFMVLVGFNAEANTRARWMQNQAETVLMLDQINVAHIASLKACACHQQRSQNQRAHEACANLPAGEPAFIRHIINMYGEHRQNQVSCQRILEQMIFQRLEFDWTDMRRAMSLMMPERLAIETGYAAASESFHGNHDIDAKLRRRIRHEIRSFPGTGVPSRDPSPITAAELSEYLIEYRSFALEQCSLLIAAKRQAGFPGLSTVRRRDYQSLTNDKICEVLITGSGSGLQPGAVWTLRADFDDVLPALARQRNTEFRQEHKTNYGAIIQGNPLLVLVSRPRPAWNELISALNYLERNARSRLAGTKRHLTSDPLRFVGRYHALSYSRANWDAKGFAAANFDTHLESVLEEFQRRQNNQAQLETIAIIGITVACVTPWGRGLSVAMNVLKTGCLVGVGVVFNGFYTLDAIVGYQRALREFFSSIEHQQAFFEDGASTVVNAQDELKLAALFIPLGIGMAEVREFRTALRSLGRI